jgi:flavin reductase (DIM6/NTAB) family NADH-FMN oxidoreductase RutF
MKLIKKILEKINGLHYKQEYLCLADDSFQHPLHAYLVDQGCVVKDITKHHLFVGYSPLIFAFSSADIPLDSLEIFLFFTDKILLPGSNVTDKDLVASVSLKKVGSFGTTEGNVIFFEGVHATHHFISRFHQFIIQLHNNWYGRKPGNVHLESNLYQQVQLAYAVPRKISLITVGGEGLYNHFPTDLHGQASAHYYIISLRHEGRACAQVEEAKRIVLSDVSATAYRKVYALGKNHMQPLKDRQAFDFDWKDAANFHLPLPKDLVAYRELELKNSFTHGIHRLLLFRIRHEETGNPKGTPLFHIHNAYATWRFKRNLKDTYLLR